MRVARSALAACLLGTASLLTAQAALLTRDTLDAALQFEGAEQSLPEAWNGGPPDTLSLDRGTVHSGESAARIQRKAGRPDAFSTLTTFIPIDFAGSKIELRGFLRTESVAGFAGLWMREDGPSGPVAFDNMHEQQIDGTREWTSYRIELPLAAGARQLYFGALLSGEGTVWADDLEILVDGVPLATVPRVIPKLTVLDTDREFTNGSGIDVQPLTSVQIVNLAVLGRVWGFLKYHHPRIARGELHWDFELFRVLPKILAASSAAERNDALLAWVERIGEPAACDPCASTPREAALAPDITWIEDEALLGDALSDHLREVYRNRFADGEQFFVGTEPGAGNPVFTNEPAYEGFTLPDSGYRLLALFRYWNMVEYWFPYRDVIGEAWTGVLTEFLPLFVTAGTRDDYEIVLARLIARINDTHARLQGGSNPLPPHGSCQVPVVVRFVDGQAIVVGYSHAVKGPESKLELGDAIVTVAGTPVERLVEDWMPYYSASNRTTKLARMATSLLRGPCEPADLGVFHDSDRRQMRAERIPVSEIDDDVLATHDKSGETFQWLTEDVAYLKLSSIRATDVLRYIEEAQGARGLIIDIRNYPSEFVVFALGGRLVSTPTEFVRFSTPDLANPGAFLKNTPLQLLPATPSYSGPVAILVDETTVSQAEYTTMALRAAPRAFVVGSTTRGADGNVSTLPLPGGLASAFSGLGVFYPDGSPTQRVGIIPDIVVAPTVESIRAERDVVLERALREIPTVEPAGAAGD